MKKSKKLLSILLAVVMVFSVVAVPVSAAVPSGVKTLDALIQPSNLAELVDWLLDSLNGRKEKYADSVLNFVCTYVEDINAVVPAGTDLFDSNDTKKKATYLMSYVDALLAEQNLNSALGDDILKIVNAIPGLTVDLNSVNGILKTLKSVDGVKGLAGGDIANLNLNAMVDGNVFTSAQSREGTGDLQIIYNLIQFLADNKGVFRKFLTGDLDLGIVGDVAGNLETQINNFAGEITIILEDLVYEKLLGAPDGAASHAASAYKDWTVDQMAVGAAVKLLTGTVPGNMEEINNFLNLPIYDLLTNYADRLYDQFLLGWLQNDLLDVLKKFAQDNNLAQYFNFDFTFSTSEFNFANAENGILGEFNNVIVALLNKLLAADVLEELQLEEGGNDKLNANLEKVVKFVLPKMADVIDPADFDFRKYTEEYVADKELKDLAVDVLKLFYPGWFHLDDAAIAVVDQMDTMGEAAALAVYYALIDFNDVMFTTEGAYDYISDWNAKIFEIDDVTGETILKDLGNSAWSNVCLDMAADAAAFGLALNGDNFSFDLDLNNIKEKKAAGWTAVNFLDEIADWGIDMIKGLPAVTDHIGGASGEVDGYGPFYKINVLLNEILDWSFLSNVSYGSFKLDIETLVFDGLLGNLYEFDLAGILGLFAVNENPTNVLRMNTVPALLSIVDNVLNILFAHTGATKAFSEAATCSNEGFTVNACEKCGLYQEKSYNKIDPLKHDIESEVIREARCDLGGIVRETCKNCDYVLRTITPTTNHTPGEIGQIVENGNIYLVQYCSVCGGEYSRTLAVSLDNIEIVSYPEKLEYEQNAEGGLDLNGLEVKAIYSDGTEEPVDLAKLTIVKNLDTSVAGEQEIEIAYYETTATFKVTVIAAEQPDEPDVPDKPDQPADVTIANPGEVAKESEDGMALAKANVTVAALLEASNATDVLDKTGKKVAADKNIATGMQLVIMDGETVVDSLTIVVIGDINGDEVISSADARTALRNSVGLDALSGAALKAADVNNDKTVNSSDARSILRASVMLDDADSWLAKF